MARPDKSWLESVKYWGILGLVFAIGGVFAAPFAFAIYRLLDCNDWLASGFFMLALRAAIATMFAGVVLSVLLLFYRLRNDDTSPSLVSGLAVVALGVVLTALVLFAARGQSAAGENPLLIGPAHAK